MILFDPVTTERKQITYNELTAITGKSLNTLYICKHKGRKVPGLNAYIVDDDTPLAHLRELMEKEVLPDEVWKPIPCTTHKVSNYGRYKGKKATGDVFCILSDKGAKITIKVNGKPVKMWAHIKVAEAFLTKPGEDYRVYHKDFNSYNCRVDNLGYLPRYKALARLARYNVGKVILKIDAVTNEVVDEYSSVIEAAKVNYCAKTTMSRYIKLGKIVDGYYYKYDKGLKQND